MIDNKNMDYIYEMMDVFYNSTGLDCVLYDSEGNELYSRKRQNIYCDFLNNNFQVGRITCKEEHYEAIEQAKKLGDAYISYCSGGLVYYTVFVDNGKFQGAIQGGPIHMTEPDIVVVELIANKNNINEEDKKRFIDSYISIPKITPSTARYQLKLLNILAHDISEKTREEKKKVKEMLDEQRQISEKLQEIKFLEKMASSKVGYPVHLEEELSECIIKGNEKDAKAILNELLGYIFFNFSGDIRRIIAMSIELVVIMSRAAIKGGARYEDIYKITSAIYDIENDNSNIEEICLNLTKILEKLILLVFPVNTQKSDQRAVIRKAIIFINQNIQNNLTLEDVADSVSLSPTYFSKLFSNEINMTLTDYLNIIRVKESKKYLVDEKISLGDIAAKLGFADQSYFTKVFKKYEGITPGKYRKKNF